MRRMRCRSKSSCCSNLVQSAELLRPLSQGASYSILKAQTRRQQGAPPRRFCLSYVSYQPPLSINTSQLPPEDAALSLPTLLLPGMEMMHRADDDSTTATDCTVALSVPKETCTKVHQPPSSFSPGNSLQ